MVLSEQQAALSLEKLLAFALHNQMIEESDMIYCRNYLLDLFEIKEPCSNALDMSQWTVPETPESILNELLDYAVEKKLIPENTPTYRDLFDTKIMGILTPRPSELIRRFNLIRKEKGIAAAAQDFYSLNQKSGYIRMDRIAKNRHWEYPSDFATLEITINLTKPEKDPREIAALKSAPQVGYPKCVLCPENVGYAGRINHPARQTLRILPLTLAGEQWYFQYSPYVYYNHHCIVLSEEHVPMKITRTTFHRLLDFLELFPHYFIGSNADLPIVGGSILSHDHFQGGYHSLPMEMAKIEYPVICERYPDIKAGVLHWPMSVLRIWGKNPSSLVDLADELLAQWRTYSDPSAHILAHSIGEKGEKIPHNTITPIARKRHKDTYELDLVLRNNRTSPEYPFGIFHPHPELHHIKKENIGLIEVMGLFILPGRLQKELAAVRDFLTGHCSPEDQNLTDPSHPLYQHAQWIFQLLSTFGSSNSKNEADAILRNAVGEKCLQVLHHCGVFKCTQKGRSDFNRFLAALDIYPI